MQGTVSEDGGRKTRQKAVAAREVMAALARVTVAEAARDSGRGSEGWEGTTRGNL